MEMALSVTYKVSVGRDPKLSFCLGERQGNQPREWPLRWEQYLEVRGPQSQEKNFRKGGEVSHVSRDED